MAPKITKYWWSDPPSILRCAVTFGSVAIASALASAMAHRWNDTPDSSLFMCAIMLSARFGGFNQGVLAIVLSVLVFDYYFLSSLHSLTANLCELPRIAIFTITSMIAGYLSASQKSTTELLRMALDELAAKAQVSESVTKALQTQNVERERCETAL
jgi:K+-sensing histidine kinase KdpD